jgi:hypothetical protein
VAGLGALALAMLWPPAIPFPSAAITEPLMALLTMATIACLVLGSKRPRVWFPVAAGFVALAAYLRPDGPMNAIAFVPALSYLDGWKARGTVAALSLAVFTVLFAPWPVRNVVRFGQPHLADGTVDRFGHDIPHYAGFWPGCRPGRATIVRRRSSSRASTTCSAARRWCSSRNTVRSSRPRTTPTTNAPRSPSCSSCVKKRGLASGLRRLHGPRAQPARPPSVARARLAAAFARVAHGVGAEN